MDHGTTGESGIEGQIILRPIFPIDRPGVVNYRPYAATVTVFDRHGHLMTQFHSDADGHFRVSLPPGQYTLRPESAGRHPHAATQTVMIADQQFAQVRITYDSGMR